MPSDTTASDARPAADAPSRHPYRYTAQLADDIETRWQQHWEAEQMFCAQNPGDPGFDAATPKFFCMDMFPYPSGAGLHVGHPEGYIATDIVSRYKRMTGHNVLHPMGWDAFGLPAEQYAIQTGIHPAETTRKSIDTFRRQLKRFGFSYDWSREFATIDPDYYRWTQWIWLRAYESYFDRELNKARPITELLERLERGEAAAGLDAGAWTSMSATDQRRFIDNQRLAYLADQTVNWCPKLGTALANEEVIDGRSERGGYSVYRKPLRQWMFRITAYAERLLHDLDLVRWPESTRAQQAEWIGRSEGAEVEFEIADHISEIKSLRVFTTRPDTIFGATYMVIAPEHPLIDAVLTSPQPKTDAAALRTYVEAARNRSDVDRQTETRDKTGVYTGVDATNPATGERIQVWTSDYVLIGYGHGAIMAVPGHDDRDFAFAQTFDLPIAKVVEPDNVTPDSPWAGVDARQWPEAFCDAGIACHSANDSVSLNALPTAEAKQRIIDWLEATGRGTRTVNYRLRDWLFSRQRYWGEPFPIVFDETGNHYPIADDHLPVVLPDMADYQPVESDDPQPLLAKATDWVNTTAGAAGVDPNILPPDTAVRRETNTMPGWAGSCWYYLRYCDPKNADRLVSREAEQYWMVSEKSDGTPHAGGVDLYIGGAEHAVLHLLYARFWHKMLFDLGEVSTPEPFGRLFHQGMITSWAFRDATGRTVPVDEVEQRDERFYLKSTGEEVEQIIAKMSKTLKNVINPDDVIADFGADTFRLYEMYMGPLDASKPWNTRDIGGLFRFLQRAWRLAIDEETGELKLASTADDSIEKQLHRTIAKVSDDIERLAFNTAIAAMIEFVNAATATAAAALSRDQLDRFVRALAPFAPHMAEELWSKLDQSQPLAYAEWPAVDPAMLVDDAVEMPVQIMGKVRGKVTVPADADAAAIEAIAMNDARIKQQLEGRTVRKVIVVPGKIINIVAN